MRTIGAVITDDTSADVQVFDHRHTQPSITVTHGRAELVLDAATARDLADLLNAAADEAERMRAARGQMRLFKGELWT